MTIGQNIIAESLLASCKSAIIKAKSQENKGHSGFRGQILEILTGDIITPIIPPEVCIASGQLISRSGEFSPQIDVVLYARSIMPPFLFDHKNGHIPVESALYCIEVKSKLNSTQMKLAVKSARATRALPVVATEHWAPTGNPQELVRGMTTGTPLPINALFAFSSDLNDPAREIARYRKLDPDADTLPAIQVICICGSGYWFFNDGWKHVRAQGEYTEVLHFLAGTANTLPQLLIAKGRPRFGNYLVQGSSLYEKV